MALERACTVASVGGLEQQTRVAGNDDADGGEVGIPILLKAKSLVFDTKAKVWTELQVEPLPKKEQEEQEKWKQQPPPQQQRHRQKPPMVPPGPHLRMPPTFEKRLDPDEEKDVNEGKARPFAFKLETGHTDDGGMVFSREHDCLFYTTANGACIVTPWSQMLDFLICRSFRAPRGPVRSNRRYKANCYQVFGCG